MDKIASARAVDISISVVSHLQAGLVFNLLSDISKFCDTSSIEVILTLNLPETLPFELETYDFPIKVLKNSSPLGFASNHNQASGSANGKYFCVLNPDVRFTNNPFTHLVNTLNDQTVGLAAPLVVNSAGEPEDSMRSFPSPLEILGKVFGRASATHIPDSGVFASPDWVAGMFMLFRHELFSKIGGFDACYFLYYEDVDICARLRLEGYQVVVCRNSTVVHEAQRVSHRNLRYLKWHLSSMLRFFFSPVYRKLRMRINSIKG
ncbi:glycosyltransferase [Pseudomonadota bacterium]